VGFSPLVLSAQVAVDATVGDPQPIDVTLGEGQIDCVATPPPGEAATATPTGGLPESGTGFAGGGASPFDWFVAGLIGAGIAWVIAGLAGARFAVAGAPSGSAPAAPRQQRADDFKPALRPARSERAARPQAAPKAARAAPKRPESDKPASWFAIARDELAGKVPEQFRPFRKRD
jgi:hypothetical protein